MLNVRVVRMGGNKKGKIAIQYLRGQLIADLIGFFRRNFSGLKRLPDLVSDHFIADSATSVRYIGVSTE